MNNTEDINILKELNLVDDYNEQLKSFKKMKTSFSFAWVNLANKPLKLSKLFEFIKYNPYVVPPRTGHVGNWNDIIDGYISYRNDNTIICSQEKTGYPLIFDLTQTEDMLMKTGDLTYLPGSVIDQGNRRLLTYFTWDGNNFIERSRENSLFVPFVLTKVNDTLIPIIKVHQDRYKKYEHINFIMFSSVILKKREFIKKILNAVIDDIIKEDKQEHELKFIINRVVTLDGQVFYNNVRINDNCFYVGETKYDNVSSLVDAILYPYMAAANPDEFFSNIKNMPNCMPLLSNHFSVILTSILYTHLPNNWDNSKSILASYNCNTHIQWGGIEMAGYPPRDLGYFHREVRYVRTIHRRILKLFDNIEPIYFILLPSSIFLLWPNDYHPKDLVLIEELIYMINIEESLSGLSHKALYNKINDKVNNWIKKVENQLSDLFKNRFISNKPSIYSNYKVKKNIFLEPKGFSDLTIQQASMLVSSLFEYFSSRL